MAESKQAHTPEPWGNTSGTAEPTVYPAQCPVCRLNDPAAFVEAVRKLLASCSPPLPRRYGEFERCSAQMVYVWTLRAMLEGGGDDG